MNHNLNNLHTYVQNIFISDLLQAIFSGPIPFTVQKSEIAFQLSRARCIECVHFGKRAWYMLHSILLRDMTRKCKTQGQRQSTHFILGEYRK
jgi:hypothetical protein